MVKIKSKHKIIWAGFVFLILFILGVTMSKPLVRIGKRVRAIKNFSLSTVANEIAQAFQNQDLQSILSLSSENFKQAEPQLSSKLDDFFLNFSDEIYSVKSDYCIKGVYGGKSSKRY